VMLQHVEDETFLDGLAHRIQVERPRLPVGASHAKPLERDIARSGREGEKAYVRLRTSPPLVLHNHILDVFAAGRFSSERNGNRLCGLVRMSALQRVENGSEVAMCLALYRLTVFRRAILIGRHDNALYSWNISFVSPDRPVNLPHHPPLLCLL